MRLSHWTKLKGIHYATTLRWVKDDRMPVPFFLSASGTTLVDEPAPTGTVAGKVAISPRVSGSGQKSDLEAQLGRLSTFAAARGLPAAEAVGEVGSGFIDHRPKPRKILADPLINVITVQYRDRLMRLRVEDVESARQAQGRSLVVVDPGDVKDELAQGRVEVLTLFCARLYGRRSAKAKAQNPLKAVRE